VAESFIATVGTTGLAKADLAIRLYQGGARIAGSEAAVTVAEIGASGDYLIGGLPDGVVGIYHTVTYEYPAGVGGAYRWRDQPGPPPAVVIPVRETGLAAVDLGLTLYLDGAAYIVALTATEVGGAGDYAIAGWPLDEPGDWVLRWSRHGITFASGWTAPASVAGGTRYLSIQSVQRPFPIGQDRLQFEQFSVNFQAIADAPVDDWEQELIAILSAAGLATPGTDAFIGRSVDLNSIPGTGPHVIVIDTGGTAPIEAHGPNGSLYERLSAQVVIRATNFVVARTRALAIWRELHGVRNQTVAA
jgi:hypothetical protein